MHLKRARIRFRCSVLRQILGRYLIYLQLWERMKFSANTDTSAAPRPYP